MSSGIHGLIGKLVSNLLQNKENNSETKSLISELKEKSLDFKSISYVHKSHKESSCRYKVRNCQEVHCLQCLKATSLISKKCEHGVELSPYELNHVEKSFSLYLNRKNRLEELRFLCRVCQQNIVKLGPSTFRNCKCKVCQDCEVKSYVNRRFFCPMDGCHTPFSCQSLDYLYSLVKDLDNEGAEGQVFLQGRLNMCDGCNLIVEEEGLSNTDKCQCYLCFICANSKETCPRCLEELQEEEEESKQEEQDEDL